MFIYAAPPHSKFFQRPEQIYFTSLYKMTGHVPAVFIQGLTKGPEYSLKYLKDSEIQLYRWEGSRRAMGQLDAISESASLR